MKNFETGHTSPTANNRNAIQGALEDAGVIFVSEDQGGPGVLARRLKLRAYIPGEGLHLEAKYADLFLEAPDNDFDLWFKIGDAVLTTLAGRAIVDEADAKSVAEKNNTRLVRAVKKVIGRDGLSSPGGRAREITAEDIR